MGRWSYNWHIRYYGSGCLLRDYYTSAKNRAEALKNLHGSGEKVVEILFCERTDKW